MIERLGGKTQQLKEIKNRQVKYFGHLKDTTLVKPILKGEVKA